MVFLSALASALVNFPFLISRPQPPATLPISFQKCGYRFQRHSYSTISLFLSGDADTEALDSETEDPEFIRKRNQDRRVLESDFRRLINLILSETNPSYIPSILTKNVETILAVMGSDGVQIVDSVLKDTIEEYGEEVTGNITQAIDLAISFAEEITEQTSQMEEQHKKLLGKIILAVSNKDNPALAREEALDELFQNERDKFTAGFLRHIEGQCARISSAPKLTTDSYQLLEILKLIQTLVLEELISGNEWSEAAQVLGQLIGYDSSAERVAVLEAGLAVRGPNFAEQLVRLTDEALEGFKTVAGGADPSLVAIIKDINQRIQRHRF